MATNTHGSFAVTTQGVYKTLQTPVAAAASIASTRSDAYVSQTIETDLGGKAITGSVTISGVGDKGTAAVNATNTMTFDDTAYTSATATWTFSAGPDSAGALDTTTITLVDFDGTSVVFEIDDAGTGAGNGVTGSNIAVINKTLDGVTVAGSMGPSNLATSLAYWINQQGTLDIVATNPGAGQITLTQGAGGEGSNTAITLSAASTWNTSSSVNCPAAFTGGAITAPSTPTVTLTGGSDVHTVTFTGVASGANAYLNQFNIDGNGATTATNLYNLIINASKGLGTARMTVAKVGGALTLTHQPAGVIGNTSAVVMGGNMGAYTSVDPDTFFSGGLDRTQVDYVLQYSVDGVTWSTGNNSSVLISDVDLASLGTYVGTVTTAIQAPFYRTGLNVDGLSNTAGAGTTLAVATNLAFKYT